MSDYSIMEGRANDSIVLLYSHPDPGPRDGWMLGRRFEGTVVEPLKVVAKPDFDEGILMPFYTAPPLMRRDLYEIIRAAGVNNIDAWDAVVRKEDGTVLSADYKAVNVLGMVRAADLSKTRFAPENPSRLVDASIESLTIDPKRARGLLMFRLAEYIAAVVVHRKVREAVERAGIPHVVFTDPPEFVS